MPRYRQDNIFDTAKFAARFPDFEVTTYREGVAEMLGDPTCERGRSS